MSNAFKVIDTQTGDDVTDHRDWVIVACGGLGFVLNGGIQVPLEEGRYQPRRCTGISDKNELFDVVLKFIDRLNDPIEDKDYLLKLVNDFAKEADPVISKYIEVNRE